MPWIKVISHDEAEGLLKEQLDAAVERAGRIWNIVGIMSLNPPVLKTSIDFYVSLFHGPSPLSRSQREMMAVVVSAALHCSY